MAKRIEQLLKNAGSHPELGGLSSARKEAIRTKLFAKINENAGVVLQPSLADALRAPFFGMEMSSLVKPFGMVAAMLVFSFGWMGSLFASFDAVPGDRLYSLKRATERAQLSFASGVTSETKLRIEFANRRAEEVTKILENQNDKSDANVKEATQNLKQELAAVSARLSSLRKTNTHEAVSLAKLVDRKFVMLQQTIDESLSRVSPEVLSDVSAVKDAAKNTSVEALTVLVETDEGAELPENLGKKVVARLAEVNVSVQKVEEQIEALQEAMGAQMARLPILTDADLAKVQKVKQFKVEVEAVRVLMKEAQGLFDGKEYSAALVKTQSVAEAVATVAAKIEAFQEPVVEPVIEPTVEKEAETPAPSPAEAATEAEAEPEAPESAPAPEAAKT